jgi:hypothetical protein
VLSPKDWWFSCARTGKRGTWERPCRARRRLAVEAGAQQHDERDVGGKIASGASTSGSWKATSNTVRFLIIVLVPLELGLARTKLLKVVSSLPI